MELQDLTPISLLSLGAEYKIAFPVYVKVNQKPILYFHADHVIEPERLARLTSKDVGVVYIPANQMLEYQSYLADLERASFEDATISLDSRCRNIQLLFQEKVAKLFLEMKDAHRIEEVCEYITSVCNFIEQEASVVPRLIFFETKKNIIAQHGIAVCILTYILMKAKGQLESHKAELKDILLGALIHDWGHTRVTNDLRAGYPEKDRDLQASYQEHVSLAYEELCAMELYSEVTLDVVRYHEEGLGGSGYPGKVDLETFHPCITTVSCCNALDRKLRFEEQDPKTALKNLLIDKMGVLPLDDLKLLQKVVKTYKIVD